MTHLWRGVIEEYRFRLPVSDATPVVTLREGGTPLVPSAWLSGMTGCSVHLKVEGSNPTGSFKDRGMTVAISKALEEGAKAVVCASTGNTSASAAAYAVRAGMTPIVLVPHGKIAGPKLAQAVVHGGRIVAVEGNFDDCLRLARALADDYPVALVNSLNPHRLAGQKTAAFEIVDDLGDAPDVHVLPVGNAREYLGVLDGLSGVRGRCCRDPTSSDVGFPGRRSRPHRARRTGRGSGDGRERDPDRQPRAHGSLPSPPATNLKWSHRRSDRRADPGRSAGAVRQGGAVRGAGRQQRAWPGWLRLPLRAQVDPGQIIVVTVSGHGLKDVDTASAAYGDVRPELVPADIGAAASALGFA